VPVAERVLTPRALNRALLARQLLLERARLSLPRALERVAGIQAQYAPSAYIGLWSRLEGFDRAGLTAALRRRRVVQGTLMRATIHLVSARDYWPFALAIRDTRRAWWLKVYPGTEAAEIEARATALERELSSGPRWRDELTAMSASDLNGAGLWLDLVRVPPSGTWEQRRAHRFALADAWLGPPGDDRDALVHLVTSYLRGFGPATRADVAGWAGLSVAKVREALDRMPLRRFRDERGGELLDIPRAPLPDPETPAPVRFLPTWDATLLVHARRTGILPEAFRPLVFNTKTPNSFPTFLVDGRVAGTWRHEGGRVLVNPFEPLPRNARGAVDDEARRLAAWHA
jgi:DNA glycosylase AlkZ-like